MIYEITVFIEQRERMYTYITNTNILHEGPITRPSLDFTRRRKKTRLREKERKREEKRLVYVLYNKMST